MIKKLLFVEDGSVDISDIEARLGDTVCVIPYRNGSAIPHLLELGSEIDDSVQNCAIRQYGQIGRELAEYLHTDKNSRGDALAFLEELYSIYYKEEESDDLR